MMPSPRLCVVALLAALSGAPAATAAPEPTRMQVDAPGGATIEVLVQGTGPAVVLLPSRGRGAADFDRLAADLATAGLRVIRPEPRGVGRSTGASADITLHDLGRDIAAVIEALHAEPAVIVGHAFGNFVARTVASDRPDLVRGVVVAAAAGKSYPESLAQAVTKSSDPSLPDAERLRFLQSTFFAPGHDPAVWLGGWYPGVDHSQRAATLRTKQSDWWSAGRAPLLEIQAAEDPFKTPAQRGELKDEFGARVSVVVIADASHALVPEQPKAVADAIIAWMKTL